MKPIEPPLTFVEIRQLEASRRFAFPCMGPDRPGIKCALVVATYHRRADIPTSPIRDMSWTLIEVPGPFRRSTDAPPESRLGFRPVSGPTNRRCENETTPARRRESHHLVAAAPIDNHRDKLLTPVSGHNYHCEPHTVFLPPCCKTSHCSVLVYFVLLQQRH